MLFARAVAIPGYRFAGLMALLWGRLLGGQPRRVGDLTVVTGLPNWAFGRGGTTIGFTFLTNRELTDGLLAHEEIHRQQWMRYGLAFIPMYFAAGADPLTNRFEIEAGLVQGGYRPKPKGRKSPRRRIDGEDL